MRRLLFLLCLAAFGSSTAQAQAPSPTVAEWRADLEYLKALIDNTYPQLYKKVSQDTVHAHFLRLSAQLPQLEPHERTVGVARIIALFGYGHTILPLGPASTGFSRLPINLYHFSDGVFLEGVHASLLPSLGAEVLAVAGVPIHDAIARIKPAFPVENEQFFEAYGLGLLTIPAVLHAQGITAELQDEIVITLRKNGRTYDLPIPADTELSPATDYGFTRHEAPWHSMRNSADTPQYLKNLDRHYDLAYLSEHKAVYARFSQVYDDSSEEIADFFARAVDTFEARTAERFVLDLRLNGGGNNFKNPAIVRQLLRSPRLQEPNRLYVILGRRTFSACQNLVNALDTYAQPLFVGEPTGENVNFFGDNRPVNLPNSQVHLRLSHAWWQDKPSWTDALWAVPQLPVALSSMEYANNEDPILEHALTFTADGFIRDPMGYLVDLFQRGEMERLRQEATRIAFAPEYSFFAFEEEFDTLGRRLLTTEGLQQAALSVLSMNYQLFPSSSAAIDGMAEALWQLGDRKEAAALSQQVIDKAPDSPAALAAAARLRKLSSDE